MTDAPSSRVSSVVSMLGDLAAFAASFLILGEVIAAGALGIAPFYVASRPSWIRELRKHLNLDCNKLMSGLRLSGSSRCYFSQPNTLCPKQRAQNVAKKGVHQLANQNQVGAKGSKASPIWPSPVRLSSTSAYSLRSASEMSFTAKRNW
jgi:hypothetical protein